MEDWKWSAKYSKMDERFKGDKQKPKTVRNNVIGLRSATKVENHDYMTSAQAEQNVEARLAEFQADGRAPRRLSTQTVDSMKFILSEGSVLGVRTGGNWKFYIQKRVLVEYFHNAPHQSLGRQQLILGVLQFWPATNGEKVVGAIYGNFSQIKEGVSLFCESKQRSESAITLTGNPLQMRLCSGSGGHLTFGHFSAEIENRYESNRSN